MRPARCGRRSWPVWRSAVSPPARSAIGSVIRCAGSAITEILIGVTAISSPAALGLLQRAYVSLYPSLPHSLGALTAVRLAIAFAALIVPTALMGATLPLVLKASVFRDSALGRQIGVLYGSNALGAIVGTISAGLYLIPGRGIHDTFLIAAGLNILVGTAALALSIAAPPLEPATPLDAAPPHAAGGGDPPFRGVGLATRATGDGPKPGAARHRAGRLRAVGRRVAGARGRLVPRPDIVSCARPCTASP